MRVDVGVSYCTLHDGLMDCDRDVCDFAKDDPEEDPECEGEPRPCTPQPLFYEIDRQPVEPDGGSSPQADPSLEPGLSCGYTVTSACDGVPAPNETGGAA